MIFLATLQETKALMKISYGDADPQISVLLGAASRVVLDYMKITGDEYRDSAGEFVPGLVPDDVKAATIYYVRYLWDTPDIALDAPGALPPAVESLLQPLRCPTVV